ncbi:protein AMN1 isoform X1 [Salvia divinorum]|uniref:Protein AMN1 isoform X1 n=1 Tax=Salvia divinorum TaxID=28513 RepID=A0ABD1FLF1_SALDI
MGSSGKSFADALNMAREISSPERLIQWSPSVGKSVAAPFVPSLLNLSLNCLARFPDEIATLELVPDNLRLRLINRMCDTRKMNAGVLKLLVEGSPTEIRVKNCSWLTQEQFQLTIGNFDTKELQVLQLDLCGQCMLDIAFKDILNKCQECFSRLTILSLRGACGLSDDGLRNLVKSAPLLRSINLGQCTLLTSDAVNCIADVLGSHLKELYIDECNKIDAMQILPAFKKFTCLEVLSVAEIHTINDQFVNGLVTASACGKILKDLDFTNCSGLTDNSLKTIGTTCDDLRSLDISNLNKLTDLGLEYLANGCRSIQTLKLCRNKFSDEAVAAFLESSGESLLELFLNGIAKVGPHTALSLAKYSRKLVYLDVSWCRKISDKGLGLIVDSCQSLKLLKIFGCMQINKGFLEGHSNPIVKIIGSRFTPIMDHLYVLEPEEEKFMRYRLLQY